MKKAESQLALFALPKGKKTREKRKAKMHLWDMQGNYVGEVDDCFAALDTYEKELAAQGIKVEEEEPQVSDTDKESMENIHHVETLIAYKVSKRKVRVKN